MPIPKNISKEHIEKAIEELRNYEIPLNRLSERYFLKFGDIEYPPKYTITIANKFANGEEWPSENFQAIEAKTYLKKLGFTIIDIKSDKIGFYFQLKQFLDQAKTDELKYSHYIKEYSGLKVKVSFGQGNQARIPWIAFLKEGETVQNGIYPVYLYYKEFKLLILAYGVSETNKPTSSWQLKDRKTIKEYFSEKELIHPDRYGNSFIFKVYDLSSYLDLDEELIDLDLDSLIEIYLNQDLVKNEPPTHQFEYNLLFISAIKVGLKISNFMILRFIASLLSKPFVVLTGLSGSGKTKLAQVFAKWICENENQYKLIPVGADWTNREPLLGYPNALETGRYVLPENGTLSIILEAAKEENQNKPYFLILDEMNLSHVERYFADFLSAMESGEEIPLRPESVDWKDNIPSKIKLPKNLFIVGTVNIDETTYMFSPKVLDRANVIEFRVSGTEMEQFLKDIKPLHLESLNGLGANMAASFVEHANNKELKPVNAGDLNTTLIDFFKELKKTGAEFGYRSASEIYRFVGVVNKLDPEWKMDQIIDCAIMQKLLPKVHGSRRKLEPVLKSLGSLCLADGKTIEEIFNRKSEVDFNDPYISKYPLSLEKIDRMYKGLIDNGFTSYAEA